MPRVTKTLEGYFVEYQDDLRGPVPTEKHAEELAVYIVAKEKNFELKGSDSISILGDRPYICHGKIVIKDNSEVKRKDVKRLYQLDAYINPKARQQQMLEQIIAQGEEIDPDDLTKQKRKEK